MKSEFSKSVATVVLVVGFGVMPATGAQAQDAAQGTGPVAENVGPNPTPICTDRPTKANVACTVPAGDVQIESDAINWTRLDVGGTRTDMVLYTNPTIKYGLGTHTDLEVNFAPYETVDTATTQNATKLGGVGDLYVRLKQRLTADSAKTQVSLVPFIKAPTARFGIGNGQWEGGLAVPVNIPVLAGFTLTLGPEVDVLADSDGAGHHANLTSLVNLSHAAGPKVTLYAEFWNSQNLDPAGTVHQYSADVAAAYSLTSTLQLDIGGNFGLNRATPATQVYVGIATRF